VTEDDSKEDYRHSVRDVKSPAACGSKVIALANA